VNMLIDIITEDDSFSNIWRDVVGCSAGQPVLTLVRKAFMATGTDVICPRVWEVMVVEGAVTGYPYRTVSWAFIHSQSLVVCNKDCIL
jgi:hypothetical protein